MPLAIETTPTQATIKVGTTGTTTSVTFLSDGSITIFPTNSLSADLTTFLGDANAWSNYRRVLTKTNARLLTGSMRKYEASSTARITGEAIYRPIGSVVSNVLGGQTISVPSLINEDGVYEMQVWQSNTPASSTLTFGFANLAPNLKAVSGASNNLTISNPQQMNFDDGTNRNVSASVSINSARFGCTIVDGSAANNFTQPFWRIIFCNMRNRKRVLFATGNTGGASISSGVWMDDKEIWKSVGSFFSSNGGSGSLNTIAYTVRRLF